MLLIAGQYQILFDFLIAFMLIADSLGIFGFNETQLGIFLVLLNLVVFVFVALTTYQRWRDEKKLRWRQPLTAQEITLVEHVMRESSLVTATSTQEHEEPAMTTHEEIPIPTENSKEGASIQQYLLRADDIEMTKKIGAGSFGEVPQTLKPINSSC